MAKYKDPKLKELALKKRIKSRTKKQKKYIPKKSYRSWRRKKGKSNIYKNLSF